MAKILIVEDSVTLLAVHKRILEKQGHQIIFAKDGEAGIQMAMTQHPDLILMDVVMPKLNGFQATRKLSRQEETSDIPVILVTSKDQETDILWGKRQGAKGYLVKPVVAAELVSMVDRLLVEA